MAPAGWQDVPRRTEGRPPAGEGRSVWKVRVPAEIYVVRIYRRGSRPGMEAAGLVETIDGRERATFASRRELWALLCGQRLSAPKRTRKPE